LALPRLLNARANTTRVPLAHSLAQLARARECQIEIGTTRHHALLTLLKNKHVLSTFSRDKFVQTEAFPLVSRILANFNFHFLGRGKLFPSKKAVKKTQ
jgi:hypothetical protein